MTALTIPHPRSDAKIVVKAAFEKCEDIKTYHDDGIRVIGKTGASMGLLTSSYGEKVIVEIPEDQPSDSETMISVSGQKEVELNIGADPEKHVSRFIKSVNSLKNKDISSIMSILSQEGIDESSKEVENETEQAGGSGMLIIVMLLIFIFVFILPLMMI